MNFSPTNFSLFGRTTSYGMTRNLISSVPAINYTIFTPGGIQLRVISSNVGDNASAPVGARVIRIYGARFDAATGADTYWFEDVTLNGTTPVLTTTTTWSRVFKAEVIQAGPNQSLSPPGWPPLGVVSITDVGGGTAFMSIQPGRPITETMVFTAISGYDGGTFGVIDNLQVVVEASGSGLLEVRWRPYTNNLVTTQTSSFRVIATLGLAGNAITSAAGPIEIPGRGDIEFGVVKVGAPTTTIQASCKIKLLTR